MSVGKKWRANVRNRLFVTVTILLQQRYFAPKTPGSFVDKFRQISLAKSFIGLFSVWSCLNRLAHQIFHCTEGSDLFGHCTTNYPELFSTFWGTSVWETSVFCLSCLNRIAHLISHYIVGGDPFDHCIELLHDGAHHHRQPHPPDCL